MKGLPNGFVMLRAENTCFWFIWPSAEVLRNLQGEQSMMGPPEEGTGKGATRRSEERGSGPSAHMPTAHHCMVSVWSRKGVTKRGAERRGHHGWAEDKSPQEGRGQASGRGGRRWRF